MKTVRCAIYCRKSSDDGLEQACNSIDAQRAAAEAYIASRAGLGWVCLPERYDDGGVSGGTLERPSLRRLMDAIEAKRVDVVVVYRLDRWTRSIRDFGALSDRLERAGVGLASITESIDTATPGGRLVLHTLLSFAQYERELAAERTAHKIAASRRRGMWTGGRPVLGYDAVDGRLEINHAEAERVRAIFARYMELGSIDALARELDAAGERTKRWVARDGTPQGGARLHKSVLHGLLTNPLYVGRVPHKGATYPGLHAAIVPEEVFGRVARMLLENRASGASLTRNRHGGLLKGLVRCGCCGTPMSHTSTRTRRGEVHRYYVCRGWSLRGGRKCATPNLPAESLERLVVGRARPRLTGPGMARRILAVSLARWEASRDALEARLALAEADLVAATARLRAGLDPRAANARAESERRISAIRSELDRHGALRPTAEGIASALAEFEALWSALSPRERRELLGTAVRGVVFESVVGEVVIELADEQDARGEAA